ncbi:MAG: YeeE/YedE family protein [Bacteroidetes bacterium]|nr:YeeE/YedE family protein [Bacteroidota bacterium]MBU1117011.1 YeeE/YedE family protein [Bacteroidota bacterium]MBU1799721.1 YeeE/YedE family protein [Bacteroidota bacterium]
MGPLVPEFINNELNLVFAVLIGIAFGFILESAGFSSSKKLAGLFYGYDFTVLRVFFTAGVTAMVGVLVLSHFGLLDLDLIYVNPLFLWSAIVGGLIMGIGFVIGGYCPGTSMCGAMIGKIDAMAFVVGAMLGILGFIEGYPLFEGLYTGYDFGIPQVSETLNISLGLFAFLMIVVAFGSYWLVGIIEKKVTKNVVVDTTSKRSLLVITVVALIIGLVASTLKPEKAMILDKINDSAYISSFEINTISSDELALRFMYKDKSLQVIDIRDSKDFQTMTLPSATNLSLNDFFTKSSKNIFNLEDKVNIIVGDNDVNSKKGYILAKELGFENVLQLKGGFNQFKSDIIDFKSSSTIEANLTDNQRFRREASSIVPVLIEKSKPKVIEKQKVRALGGCG